MRVNVFLTSNQKKKKKTKVNFNFDLILLQKSLGLIKVAAQYFHETKQDRKKERVNVCRQKVVLSCRTTNWKLISPELQIYAESESSNSSFYL